MITREIFAGLFFTTVVVVGIVFEMVVMMVRDVWENKFESDFNDDEGDGNTYIDFDVHFPNQINNC